MLATVGAKARNLGVMLLHILEAGWKLYFLKISLSENHSKFGFKRTTVNTPKLNSGASSDSHATWYFDPDILKIILGNNC